MNKTERLLYQKHNLSDEERNQCLKLITCGLTTREIADIMHISNSTVSYIRQAHTACINKDWDTLQRLSTSGAKACVEWAMKLTGTDKVFEETFKKPAEPEVIVPVGIVTNTTAKEPETLHPGNLYELYAVLTDIRSLLTEIRDILK